MSLIGKALAWLLALVGLVVWLGGAYELTLQSSGAVADELPRKIAALVGVPFLLVGSVLLLRLTGRLRDFLIGVVFAGLLCVYGVGVPGAPARSASTETTSASTEPEQEAAATPPPPAPAAASAPPGAAAPENAELASHQQRDHNARAVEAEQTESRSATAGPSPRSAPTPPRSAPSMAPPAPSAPPVTEDVVPAPVTTRSAHAGEQTSATNAPLSARDFTMEDLRFNKPDSMRINHPYVIEAQIGVPVASALPTTGPQVTRSVPIPGSRMVRVELVADDFDIQKLHQVDNQLLTPGTTASWMWRVTPRHVGDQGQLLLQVFGVLRQQGYEGAVLIKTYQESIPVEVTPIDRVEIGAQAFLSRWDLVAGVAGAVGGLWVFFGNLLRLARGRRPETT